MTSRIPEEWSSGDDINEEWGNKVVSMARDMYKDSFRGSVFAGFDREKMRIVPLPINYSDYAALSIRDRRVFWNSGITPFIVSRTPPRSPSIDILSPYWVDISTTPTLKRYRDNSWQPAALFAWNKSEWEPLTAPAITTGYRPVGDIEPPSPARTLIQADLERIDTTVKLQDDTPIRIFTMLKVDVSRISTDTFYLALTDSSNESIPGLGALFRNTDGTFNTGRASTALMTLGINTRLWASSKAIDYPRGVEGINDIAKVFLQVPPHWVTGGNPSFEKIDAQNFFTVIEKI